MPVPGGRAALAPQLQGRDTQSHVVRGQTHQFVQDQVGVLPEILAVVEPPPAVVVAAAAAAMAAAACGRCVSRCTRSLLRRCSRG